MKKTYQEGKEEARNEAIDWQSEFGEHSYTWADLADWAEYFRKKAKRYGLIREFRENGII